MWGPRGWIPLHATVEGWVESVALAYHAARWAKQITKISGDDVDGLQLEGYDPVPEIAGLSDNWWRGPDSLVATFNGEAECSEGPAWRTAFIYSGLNLDAILRP
jgi:hypothetical protein